MRSVSSPGFGLSPQPFETMSGNVGVMRRVLGIPVAEVIQQGPEIGALISQVVAAGVAQHVGPNPVKLCLLAGQAHDVVDGLAGQLGLTQRGTARADCLRGWQGSV
jgi:hypothetical protein